ALEGSYRFLRRVWQFGARLGALENIAASGQLAGTGIELGKTAKALRRDIHSVLGQVDYDYQRLQYNTVVSGAMKMLNALESFHGDGSPGDRAALAEGFSKLLRVLYPVTPHIAHALWLQLGFAAVHGELLDAPWPKVDEQALKQDEIALMLQINGKLRGSVLVPAGAGKDAIEQAALASEAVARHAGGGAVKRVIVVPGRLVNVVMG
ncbi:MAG: class I tRNA ligase family protein, partial [Burkholderiaceae bacterium]|nr:class I tRNA ligase family protein [Burkholderiaceae bacterium]